jgi:hypothetical protein
MFVLVGDGGNILWSLNGSNWSAGTSGVISCLYSVYYENNIFVAVGDGGVVLFSEDGITWTQQSSPPVAMYSITYGNNRFLTVGEGGKYFYINPVFKINPVLPPFRQSVIDHTSMNNLNVNLFQTITTGKKFSTTIKTLVDENVFPKTTHTLLTVYNYSYINTVLPQTTGTTRNQLILYNCTNETYTAIKISVINSSAVTLQLYIAIARP